MTKVRETVLEIDLKALSHNFNFIKSKLSAHTKTLGVIKAFAYGSDAIEVAKALVLENVDYFAVAYTQEGVALRDAGICTPILVLHPQMADLETIIDRGLEPSLYNFRIFRAFLNVVKAKDQKNYPIHIKFNTGLNRLGFNSLETGDFCNEFKNQSVLDLRSVFSHLAASEDRNENEFTKGQIVKFVEITKHLNNELGISPMRHILNSSGIFNYPEAQFDMVRTGIALYGFGNDPLYTQKLKPVFKLKTVISQIHEIKPGESVGYNRKFKAMKPMRTATLPIGHADGIHRAFGDRKGFVWIDGQKAEIVGNVCMDMIMVDVSTIKCEEGDEVVIFENQHQVNLLAEQIDSISYEILTAISQRIKRILK
ncbi:alanine racemase [Flavobacteriaceae bacterium F08102]|nr:alanine racemase [Flavobacteriaceae bacterium F08102]